MHHFEINHLRSLPYIHNIFQPPLDWKNIQRRPNAGTGMKLRLMSMLWIFSYLIIPKIFFNFGIMFNIVWHFFNSVLWRCPPKNYFSFIQGLTNIYANGIQKFVYDTCVDAFGEAQCKRQGFSSSSVFAIDGDNYSVGENLVALFAVGTAAFLLVLTNEVIIYHIA